MPPKGWRKEPGTRAGNAKAHRVWYVRTDAALDEVIGRHAFERGVGKTTLVEDMVRMVTLAITDPEDPLFAPARMALSKITPVPERKPGYRESLGIESDITIDPDSHLSAALK